MLANQLNSDFAATFVGHIDKFAAGGFFNQRCDDLIFLLRARSAHFQLASGCFDGTYVFLRRFIRRFCVDPQHKFIQRKHRHRSHVFPAEWHACGQWRGKHIG